MEMDLLLAPMVLERVNILLRTGKMKVGPVLAPQVFLKDLLDLENLVARLQL